MHRAVQAPVRPASSGQQVTPRSSMSSRRDLHCRSSGKHFHCLVVLADHLVKRGNIVSSCRVVVGVLLHQHLNRRLGIVTNVLVFTVFQLGEIDCHAVRPDVVQSHHTVVRKQIRCRLSFLSRPLLPDRRSATRSHGALWRRPAWLVPRSIQDDGSPSPGASPRSEPCPDTLRAHPRINDS